MHLVEELKERILIHLEEGGHRVIFDMVVHKSREHGTDLYELIIYTINPKRKDKNRLGVFKGTSESGPYQDALRFLSTINERKPVMISWDGNDSWYYCDEVAAIENFRSTHDCDHYTVTLGAF